MDDLPHSSDMEVIQCKYHNRDLRTHVTEELRLVMVQDSGNDLQCWCHGHGLHLHEGWFSTSSFPNASDRSLRRSTSHQPFEEHLLDYCDLRSFSTMLCSMHSHSLPPRLNSRREGSRTTGSLMLFVHLPKIRMNRDDGALFLCFFERISPRSRMYLWADAMRWTGGRDVECDQTGGGASFS